MVSTTSLLSSLPVVAAAAAFVVATASTVQSPAKVLPWSSTLTEARPAAIKSWRVDLWCTLTV